MVAEARLIHNQHPIPVIEMADRPRRCDIQDLLVIPDGARQQVLQPVRLLTCANNPTVTNYSCRYFAAAPSPASLTFTCQRK